MQEIYLDNSATTKVCEEAAKTAFSLMTETYGNPSSLHKMGFEAERALRLAREQVAKVLSAQPEEIIFTSGGTEADNLALFGAAHARKKRGNRIVSTVIEHPAVLNTLHALEEEGFEVLYLTPDKEGHISPEQVFEAVTPDTILVSMMAVNNEVGTILPIEAAHMAIESSGAPALLHVDAVQAFGKLPISPKHLGIDLLSISAHKIHGPKGVGALYLKKGITIRPHTFGGGQERNLRPGTEAMPLIGAFGTACSVLPSPLVSRKKAQALSDLLFETLAPVPGVVRNSPSDALPFVCNLSILGIRAETMLHFLSSKNIYVSSGSACSKGKKSPVLSAMKLSSERIDSALRVSFSRYNTEEDVLAFCEAVQEGIRSLQHV